MKIEIGKTYICKNGRKATIISGDGANIEFPIVVSLNGSSGPVNYTKEGKFYVRSESDFDIVKEAESPDNAGLWKIIHEEVGCDFKKVTMEMYTHNGSVFRVSTHFWNEFGIGTASSEALVYVPD